MKRQLQDRDENFEQLPALQAQVQEQAQIKVESSSKLPLKLFGTVASNTFYNTGNPNWLDIPKYREPEKPCVS